MPNRIRTREDVTALDRHTSARRPSCKRDATKRRGCGRAPRTGPRGVTLSNGNVAVAPIVVEALALRVADRGRWAIPPPGHLARPRRDPDQACPSARRRARGRRPDGGALHELALRTGRADRAELNAVCPDPRPELPAAELADPRIVRGDGPASPTPGEVRPEHVAAHALGHLALLLDTDPAVRAALDRRAGGRRGPRGPGAHARGRAAGALTGVRTRAGSGRTGRAGR